jgi:trk system potassium uptake protein TrkA
MSRSLYIVIAGCGRLGSLLANNLSKQGHSVVVIDRNEAKFAGLNAEFSGFTIAGDAVETEVLRRAKSSQADCFLATTNRDNVNLMLAQVARTVFKVPLVIARIFDPAHEAVYQQLGIATISPTRLSAQAFQEAIVRGTGGPA